MELFMIIKSVSGRSIVDTQHKTMRQTLEWCADKGLDLSGADLRQARLSFAALDGLIAQGACFWGADFTGADIGFADFSHADMRCVNLKDTCLAESDLSHANLQGAYFSSTILENACLENAILSCPSFWDCDLQGIAGFSGVIFNHFGETALTLSSLPLVVKGFYKRLVLMNNHCLWGNDLYESGNLPLDAQRALFDAKICLERVMRGNYSRTATKPIQKIHSARGVF